MDTQTFLAKLESLPESAKWPFLVKILISGLIFVLIIMTVIILFVPQLLFFLSMASIATIITAWKFTRLIRKSNFMQKVGNLLGFDYALVASINTTGGNFFNGEGFLTNVLSGTLNNLPLRIFDFEVANHAKQDKFGMFSIFEITYPYHMPNIVLAAKSFAHLPINTSVMRSLELEGDFPTYFSLFVEKGFEQEALQILTPDIMADLIDKAKNIGFESYDHKLYLIQNGAVDSKQKLISFVETSATLGKTLESNFKETSDDVIAKESIRRA